MRSYLEIYSLDGTTALPFGRHQQILRNDYSRDNQYDYNHPNARSSSGRGKGTGVSGGSQHWLPHLSGQIGIINYGNFDTALSSGAGCSSDVEARNQMLGRSLYTEYNPYGTTIDTSVNQLEGQFILN